MKNRAFIILVGMLIAGVFPVVGQAQTGFSVGSSFELSDTATATWDSVNIGASIIPKVLILRNDGSVNLHLSILDDTATGKFITLKTTESLRIDHLLPVGYVRIKAVSSCLYRLQVLKPK